MKRVSQFDIYLLGMVRSLTGIKSGHRIADHRDQIVLSYIALNIFCNDDGNQILLSRYVEEAKHLRATVEGLDSEMEKLLSTAMPKGIVNDGAHELLQRSLAAFDTTLKHELNSLPTYVIENTGGIYDTDALLSRAEEAIPPDLRPLIPVEVLEDFRRAGACLGFELYTASGFHGFRAVDTMLRAYCTHFTGGLPLQRDWGAFIRAVRGVSAPAARIPNTRTIELIDRVRAEDRNPLIHPETNLDATAAYMAFDLCRSVIVFMATDIKNAP